MCFIKYTMKESSILQGTYFILVECMPAKYKKVLIFHFNCGARMNTFCPTDCCVYVQFNRQCCETHSVVLV